MSAAAAEWDLDAIRASRAEAAICATSGAPHDLAASDLVLALHEGGQDLHLLDAGTLTPRARCQLPQPLQGAPLRSPDGRHLYLAGVAGAVWRVDLQQPPTALQVRTGLQLQGLALSADGRWLLAGHSDPHSLVLLDAQLEPVRLYRAATLDGRTTSAVGSLWHSAARRSFIVGLRALPEIWELSYDPAAAPLYDGLVHDYRMAEGIASAGFLGVRRTPLEQAVQLIGGDATRRHLLALPHAAGTAPAPLQVINLDVRRRLVTRAVPAALRAACSAAYANPHGSWLALTTQDEGRVVLLDTRTWQLQADPLPDLRQVAAVHTHAATPWLWLRHTASSTLTLVDKGDAQRRAVLHADDAPWVDMAFSARGRQAVLASGGAGGALQLVDSQTLQPRQRLALPRLQAVYALDAP